MEWTGDWVAACLPSDSCSRIHRLMDNASRTPHRVFMMMMIRWREFVNEMPQQRRGWQGEEVEGRMEGGIVIYYKRGENV